MLAAGGFHQHGIAGLQKSAQDSSRRGMVGAGKHARRVHTGIYRFTGNNRPQRPDRDNTIPWSRRKG